MKEIIATRQRENPGRQETGAESSNSRSRYFIVYYPFLNE